jgi:YcxB-like protein
MEIQYQNSKDDFLEGQADLATWTRQRARRSPASLGFGAAWGLFLVAWFAVWQSSPYAQVSLFSIHLFLPFAVFMILLCFLNIRPHIRAHDWKQVVRLAIVNLASVILVLVGVVIMGNSGGLSGKPETGRVPWLQLVLTHAAWIFLFLGYALLLLNHQRKYGRLLWEGQPSVMRAKTADITAAGICVADAFSRVEYKWPAFVRFSETTNLFLLYNSNFSFLMIPKRAFPDQEHLEAMRALARTIAPATAAFPVQPIAEQ